MKIKAALHVLEGRLLNEPRRKVSGLPRPRIMERRIIPPSRESTNRISEDEEEQLRDCTAAANAYSCKTEDPRRFKATMEETQCVMQHCVLLLGFG